MSSLSALVTDLASGHVIVVDLTQPLGPETAVIGLPAMFASSRRFDSPVRAIALVPA